MFYIAIVFGVFFCTYWIAQLVFVRRHQNWSRQIQTSDESDAATPVTVIHPIKDLDFELEKNLETWLNQDYKGAVQHIFSFQDPNDPAIPVVKGLKEKHSGMDIDIIVNPILNGLNGKSSNMVHAVRQSKYDMLVFGDSDIRVKQDFLIKMVRPLKNEKTGITTCGQMNIGGKDFWTRFFTFLQNCETDYNWAFLTRIGMDVGMTGAAFAMRKNLLEEIGGLEAFGGSLLEDLHIGNTLYRMGYDIVLGPFVECHVQKLEKEKSLNYAKRLGIGIRMHITFELPAFVVMLFWYWAFLILGVIFTDTRLLLLVLVVMCIRTIQGLFQRLLSANKIRPVDLVMPMFFDLFGTFYLIYSFNKPYVTWRGITYDVKKGGFIEGMTVEK